VENMQSQASLLYFSAVLSCFSLSEIGVSLGYNAVFSELAPSTMFFSCALLCTRPS